MYVIPSLDLTLLDTSIQGLQTEFSLCKEVIQIHTLPLTAEIAAHHSLRAFFQIRTWIEGEEINPCEFGWSIVNGKLMPIKTAKQPALMHFMQLYVASANPTLTPVGVHAENTA